MYEKLNAIVPTWILYTKFHHIFQIKGHNSILFDKIKRYAIPKHSFLISTLMQSLARIDQIMLKIEHGNQFSTSIKGNNSVLIWRNLPIYDHKPILPNINSYTMFEENRSSNTQDRAPKPIFNINQGQ